MRCAHGSPCTVCLIGVLLFASSASALAEDGQPAGIRHAISRAFQRQAHDVPPRDPLAVPTKNPPHRFFDRTNITLTGVEVGMLLADGATTQSAMRKYPTGREANPLARPFVNAGWPGMIAGGAMLVSGEVGLRYLLHRKNHHKWERWIPVFFITDNTIGTIHNARLLSQDRDRRLATGRLSTDFHPLHHRFHLSQRVAPHFAIERARESHAER